MNSADANAMVETASALESRDWERLQDGVRAFRNALKRGERPAIEAYAPEGQPGRAALLIELAHEEMEFLARAGKLMGPGPCRERFPELTDDWPGASGAQTPTRAASEAGGPPRPPSGRIGRYELREVLGQGTFGTVYRAWDVLLTRVVALKRARDGALEGPERIEGFLREARSVAALRHPRIVPVYDAGHAAGELYQVGMLVEGRNLADELRARRPGFREAARWAADLADALDHAHGRGIVHRDVKPSNILIDQERQSYLADFGLAKINDGATASLGGPMVGTPAYMAPEQTRDGPVPIDARVDVYGLGAVLYEMLTGARPFAGTGAMLLARIREEDPCPPRRLDVAVPKDLETICLKAMAKAPAHRYATAADLAADLRRWLDGRPVTARPVGPAAALWRKCRRRPLPSVLAVSLALAIVCGFVGVTIEWRRAEAFRRRAEAHLVEARHERARAAGALKQGHRALATLNRLVGHERPTGMSSRSREALHGLLAGYLSAFRDRFDDDDGMRFELAQATYHIARLAETRAAPSDAIAAWREARRLHRALARERPNDPRALHQFARGLWREARFLHGLGRGAEAAPLLADAREGLLRGMALADVRPIRSSNGPADRRQSARLAMLLAEIEDEAGRAAQATAAWRRVDDLLHADLQAPNAADREEARSIIAEARLRVLDSLRRSDPEQARAECRRCAEWVDAISTADEAASSAQFTHAYYCFILGVAEDHLDQPVPAMKHLRRAAETYERLDRLDALSVSERIALGTCHHDIGRLHVEAGRPAEGLEPYRRAIAVREALRQADPRCRAHADDCGGSWYRLGEALELLGRLDEARAAYEKGAAYRRALAARVPEDARFRRALDMQLHDLARLLIALGRPREAIAATRERRALAPHDPTIALAVAGQLAAAASLDRGLGPWPIGPCLGALLDAAGRAYARESLSAAVASATLALALEARRDGPVAQLEP